MTAFDKREPLLVVYVSKNSLLVHIHYPFDGFDLLTVLKASCLLNSPQELVVTLRPSQFRADEFRKSLNFLRITGKQLGEEGLAVVNTSFG